MVAVYKPGETIYIGKPRMGAWVSGPSGPTFLARFDFNVDQAAPLSSPYTEGNGSLTLTGNARISVDGGQLVMVGDGVAYTTTAVAGSALARVTGRCLCIKLISTTGTRTAFLGTSVYRFNPANTRVTVAAGATPDSTILNANGNYFVVLRSAGAFFIQGTTLCWVDNTGGGTLVADIQQFSTSTIRYDNLRVTDLPAPFDTDYGLATQRLAGARTAGDTFTHEANCVIEWTQTTVQSAGSTLVKFRIQDASNYWHISIGVSTTLYLEEVVAGVTTTRGSSGAAVSNGNRIVVVVDGSTIRVYSNNILKITYSSATNFATATAGELNSLGTGGAVSDIVSFPRTLTGTAANLLDAAVA